MVADYAPDRQSLEFLQTVEPLVSAQGFQIVELKARTVKGQMHVNIVLSGPSGTTIDDVADVHRAVQPVIESMTEGRDLDLEVSTPGIERTLKSTREFSVFEGRGVRVLIDSTQQWVAGIIRSADDTSVTVEGDRGTETIPYSGIVKAKLDYTQEEGR